MNNNSINRMSYEDRINKNYNTAEAFLQQLGQQYQDLSGENKIIDIYNNCHLELEKEKNNFVKKYSNYQNHNVYDGDIIIQFKEDLSVFNKKVSTIAFLMLSNIKEVVSENQKIVIKENTLNKKNKRIEEINDIIDNKENSLSNIRVEKGNRSERKLLKAETNSLNSDLKGLKEEKKQLEAQIKNSEHPRALEGLALASQKASEETLHHLSVAPFNRQNNLSLIDQEKLKELKSGALRPDRQGVIGINGTYRIEFSLTEEKIQKQFKSFLNQHLSDKPRVTIRKEININGQATSELVPINKEFDTKINSKFASENNNIPHEEVHFFDDIFKDKGCSSANREKHAVNAYFVSLDDYLYMNLYKGLRHAIASNFYEVDPAERARVSKTMSEELFTAWILEEISSRFSSLEEAAEASKLNPLKFNFTSVSLVTPDIYRKVAAKLKIKGIEENEREMLEEQKVGFTSAFKKSDTPTMNLDDSIHEEFSINNFDSNFRDNIEDDFIFVEDDFVDVIEIQGHEIHVKINVDQFNFGVNAGAVKYSNLNLGIRKQFEGNIQAWNSLKEQIEKIENNFYTNAEDFQKWEIQVLTPLLKNAAKLKEDIDLLLDDKYSYLNGTNQYEAGAKILLLTHAIDQLSYALNTKNGQFPYFCGLFNCKSGKDRTGIMNDVVFTLAYMAKINKSFPSHEKLENNPELRKQFKEIFSYMVLNSGSIDITEINTDALGYKVGEEAKLGILDDLIFNILKGLSKTTSA